MYYNILNLIEYYLTSKLRLTLFIELHTNIVTKPVRYLLITSMTLLVQNL